MFVFLISFSCKKEIISLDNSNKNFPLIDTNGEDFVENDFALVSFNDVFNSRLDSVYIFNEKNFIQKLKVGCDNNFKAELGIKYKFMKKDKNGVLIPLYGYGTSVDTYFTFLTNNSKYPVYCVDYFQEGLMILAIVRDKNLKCKNSNFTLNTWF